MALKGKAERRADWLAYRHGVWLQSLAGLALAQLQDSLNHMRYQLAHTPACHRHKRARLAANINVVELAIKGRGVEVGQ